MMFTGPDGNSLHPLLRETPLPGRPVSM